MKHDLFLNEIHDIKKKKKHKHKIKHAIEMIKKHEPFFVST
jgi:hypothetical protein